RLAEVAEGLGLSPDELTDRLLPDFDLAADGTTTLDGHTVGFDEQLKPYVVGRADLPKTSAARADWLALKRSVRTFASEQIKRLQDAFVTQRRWRGAEVHRLFAEHPLLHHLGRRLLWGHFDADGQFVTGLRIAEDGTFADVEDAAASVADDASLGL